LQSKDDKHSSQDEGIIDDGSINHRRNLHEEYPRMRGNMRIPSLHKKDSPTHKKRLGVLTTHTPRQTREAVADFLSLINKNNE
jgi:hypothetical protein